MGSQILETVIMNGCFITTKSGRPEVFKGRITRCKTNDDTNASDGGFVVFIAERLAQW